MTTLHSRRDFLWNGGLGFGALALGDLLRAKSRAGQPAADPLAARPPHFPAKAKSVIFLFMQGGPSHLETFDPKPVMKKFDGQLLPESLRNFDLAQINAADSKVLAPQFSSPVARLLEPPPLNPLFRSYESTGSDVGLAAFFVEDNQHGTVLEVYHRGIRAG